jgi:hypothetical protein
VAQPIFVKIIIQLLPPKKLGYCNNLPKEINRPLGDNSPNLVTLPRKHKISTDVKVVFHLDTK